MAASTFQPGGISRELELLLLLAIRAGSADRGRIETLLAGPLDWDRLFDLAMHHRVAPILLARLSERAAAAPAWFTERLRAKSEAIARNNLLLTGELIAILKLFAANAIPALPLKGPVLAMRLYGNLAHRPFGDLDILIPSEHAARAQELLRAAGYEPKPALSPAQERAWLHFDHDRTFVNRGTGGYLELHWAFFSRYVAFNLGGGDFWERLPRGEIGGMATPELPPEELLIFLAVHGAKHHWVSLGWVVDIERLVAAYPALDWKRLRAVARATGTERMVILALRVAMEFTGMELPEEEAGWVMRDEKAAMLARKVGEMIARARGEDEIGEREEHRFYRAARERLRDRLRYYWFWTLTPNGRDRSVADLPRGLYGLYYLMRPIGIAKRMMLGD